MRKDGTLPEKHEKPEDAPKEPTVSKTKSPLLKDIRGLIEETRSAVAITVNAGLTMLYWNVGKRIRKEILKNKRAEYGKQIYPELSNLLTEEFGRGWSERNLANMVRFAEIITDDRILQALTAKLTEEYGRGWSARNMNSMIQFAEVLSKKRIAQALTAKLTWTHLNHLIYIGDPLRRDFYIEMCKHENWSTRMLKKKIDSMLYERTDLSKQPKEIIRRDIDNLRDKDVMTPEMVFRDPYFLDFLNIQDRHLEKNIEDAILSEMETFLLELGSGFTFLARQKRIQIDEDDFYIDLLFYHRDLKRLICIDLKLGKFKAEYKGKMELYLKWLNRYERRPDEKMPLGIILCAGKKQEQIELLELGDSGIHVANYCKEIPSQEVLQKQFRKAIERSKRRMDYKILE
jgi:predicted nuclease of restriction endonuclease-like (RecB) superfamily